MGDVVSLSFEHKCQTAADFARRYRVLAAMGPDGVRFTMSPDELRAMADFFDLVSRRRDTLVVEVERPMPRFVQVLLCWSLGVFAYEALGDAAKAVLLWWGAV